MFDFNRLNSIGPYVCIYRWCFLCKFISVSKAISENFKVTLPLELADSVPDIQIAKVLQILGSKLMEDSFSQSSFKSFSFS